MNYSTKDSFFSRTKSLLTHTPAKISQFLFERILILTKFLFIDLRLLRQMEWIWLGHKKTLPKSSLAPSLPFEKSQNSLFQLFLKHQGTGVAKWDHYLEIYDRHFSRFKGKEVTLLEIGVHSGGSLELWNTYFEGKCKIYGVDIELGCKRFETPNTKIFIGNQGDRGFWKKFRDEVPHLDIVIDDGSHHYLDQITAFEELLPHIQPGGIYACEDLTKPFNQFRAFVTGLSTQMDTRSKLLHQSQDRFEYQTNHIQSAIHSIHHYPFTCIIEKNPHPIPLLTNRKIGTQWLPHKL